VACKKYLDLPQGEFGIKISEIGPYELKNGTGTGKDRWEWHFSPTLTKACNMCEDRVAKNKLPMCIQHCQAWCMYYGEIEELVKKIDGKTRFTLLTK
jgi:Fe-S-cluster-containing dehydrogenase component